MEHASVADVGASVLTRLPKVGPLTSGDGATVTMPLSFILGWGFVSGVAAGLFVHVLVSNPHKKS